MKSILFFVVCFIVVGGNSQFLRGVKKIIPLRNKNLFYRQRKESNYYVQEHDNGKVPLSGKGQRLESQIILINPFFKDRNRIQN